MLCYYIHIIFNIQSHEIWTFNSDRWCLVLASFNSIFFPSFLPFLLSLHHQNWPWIKNKKKKVRNLHSFVYRSSQATRTTPLAYNIIEVGFSHSHNERWIPFIHMFHSLKCFWWIWWNNVFDAIAKLLFWLCFHRRPIMLMSMTLQIFLYFAFLSSFASSATKLVYIMLSNV